MGVLVFLLRGVNVGGRGRLPMSILRNVADELGMINPRTYIQSGNLVARWDRDADHAAEALRGAITDAVGFTPVVHARTDQELRGVMEASPFLVDGVDQRELHVTFLGADAATVLDALDIDSFATERAVAVGRELHLHLPRGIGRSPLATAMARTPGASTGTTRNWRTVTKLVSMVDDR